MHALELIDFQTTYHIYNLRKVNHYIIYITCIQSQYYGLSLDEDDDDDDMNSTSSTPCSCLPLVTSFVRLLAMMSKLEEVSYCEHIKFVIIIFIYKASEEIKYCGGAVASWLVHSTPEQVIRDRALLWARDIVLCSWARHLTLIMVPLSTQVYKWFAANLMLGVSL